MAVGGWLGTRSGRLHFCGDRGFRATVSGTTRGYPRHPARWLIGRDVASVAWLRGALGVWRLPQSAAYAPRARRGEGTRNESDPALFGLYRGRCRPAGAARLGMASATGLERWLVSASAPSPVSAGALRSASAPAPCVASGPASSPVAAAALRMVSAQRRVGYQPRPQEWYQLQQNVWYPPGWYQPQRRSRGTSPGATSLASSPA